MENQLRANDPPEVAATLARLIAAGHARDEAVTHHAPNQMHILISNLHEDAAALCQQLSCHDKSVAQIGEVGVNAQLPRIAEGLDHLRFA